MTQQFQFPDGVLIPIRARMVSVQPIETFPDVEPAERAGLFYSVAVRICLDVFKALDPMKIIHVSSL